MMLEVYVGSDPPPVPPGIMHLCWIRGLWRVLLAEATSLCCPAAAATAVGWGQKLPVLRAVKAALLRARLHPGSPSIHTL